MSGRNGAAQIGRMDEARASPRRRIPFARDCGRRVLDGGDGKPLGDATEEWKRLNAVVNCRCTPEFRKAVMGQMLR